ncbi:MAG: class I SAM-dependent methyltransferase [Pseudomonadota bacterium]
MSNPFSTHNHIKTGEHQNNPPATIMHDLIALNNLTQRSDGVYCLPGQIDQGFDYSDGAQTERYLAEVLDDVNDLDSRSAELQSRIVDWPTEYHLSSDRSNLLRGYDLSECERVLELGSGCGAISRYLGEQGLTVDAIEGSAVRADLGRKRCRDLPNVRVIHANYNDLQLPAEHYDLIVFVGVLEYAAKFMPDASSDREAALSVLRESRSHLNSEGVVLVAIENRLGLKYMLGCHEDHYAKRYIGIDGYPESAGIATYSYDEWLSIATGAGFSETEFMYPFPDYKIPRVLLGHSYLQKNPYAFNHLEGITSRDYTAHRPPSFLEANCWQAASSGNFLGKIANSFSILMGNNRDVLRQIQGFDFCHLPGPSRKIQFAVKTCKPADEDRVLKRRLCSSGHRTPEGFDQDLSEQTFHRGRLLSSVWLRSILTYVRREEYEQKLHQYFEFLEESEQDDELNVDLLPINIMVNDSGMYAPFDMEWRVDLPLSKEFILFRALLYFVVDNWRVMREFLEWLELATVQDFVDYGFRANLIRLNPLLDDLIRLEETFQRTISALPECVDIRAMLATEFAFTADEEIIYPSCEILSTSGEMLCRSDQELALTTEEKLLSFEITVGQDNQAAELRFRPFDLRKPQSLGFFTVSSVVIRETMTAEPVLKMETPDQIRRSSTVSNLEIMTEQDEVLYAATSAFPEVRFQIPDNVISELPPRFYVQIEMGVPPSRDYQRAKHHFLAKTREYDKQLGDLEDEIRESREIRETFKILRADAQALREEVRVIKASKPYNLGQKIVSLTESGKKLLRMGRP